MNQHFSAIDGDRLAKRNALVLAGAQALGGANPAIIVSLGGIVGAQLVSDQAFATVPVSLMQLGIACGVIPAAMLMRRLGRRNGYLIGALVGNPLVAMVITGAMLGLGIAVVDEMADVVSQLTKQGHKVRCILTESATQFVTPRKGGLDRRET